MAVVDDLVQDAFILAFVSLKDLKNIHRFSQWLTSITTLVVMTICIRFGTAEAGDLRYL